MVALTIVVTMTRMTKIPSNRGHSVRTMAQAAAAVTAIGLVGLATTAGAQETAAAGDHQVTFTRDVAPILQRSCQSCHRVGSIGPMSLVTYEETRPWARSVKQKVAQREMPPWYIEHNIGIQTFVDDPSLTDEEVAVIVQWVDGGTPRGDPADMPPPRQFAEADLWQLGEPDLLIHLPEPVIVPAEAPDWWLNVETEPLDLAEDRYIRAVESRPSLPGAEKVVHHAVTSMIFPDGERGFLNEYAVGKNADIFPTGTGRLIKAGTKIRYSLHVHAIGEETPADVVVALKFYPKGYTPDHVVFAAHAADSYDTIDIPAGDDNARADGYYFLKEPAQVVSFQPHLHNRGKRQCVEAIYPSGLVETLSCAQHNFAWMLNYTYTEDAQPLLPAGTNLHLISWYDNSENNRYNPDPRNWIGFGNRSMDEMSHTWMNIFYLSEEEFEQRVEARRAKRANN